MAGAPKGNKNAVGNKGGGPPTFQDRELAARVRSLALTQIEFALTGKLFADDTEFQKALLLKLASTVLPRINELTGEGGGPLTVQLIQYASANNPAPQVPAPGISVTPP
jgi:hypothetical protein